MKTFAPLSPTSGPTFWKTTHARGGNDPKPVDFFSLYFTDEVFESPAYKTNCYTEQCKKNIPEKHQSK